MARATTFAWPDGKALALSLTFDDARPSQVETAFPILEEYGVKATFFVTPDNLETRVPQWRELVAAGHELGNHTVSHPCSIDYSFCRDHGLQDFTLERMEEELLECNRRVKAACGVTPKTFAYPCGHTFVGRGASTQSYVPLVAKHFIAGRGYPSEHHAMPAICDLAQLNGCCIDGFAYTRVKPWIDEARREGGWLVLVGHDVGEEACHQTVPSGTLRAICAHAADPESGIWADTVASIAQYVAARQVFGERQGP